MECYFLHIKNFKASLIIYYYKSGHLIHSYLKQSFILDKNFSPRFAKEQNFTLQQISAFFTLLKVMLDNIKGKQKFLGWTTPIHGSYSRFAAIVKQTKKKKQKMLGQSIMLSCNDI